MEITYYVDVLFMINFSMDFFLLCFLRMILKLKGRKLRLAAGSAAGAGLAVIVQYAWLRMLFTGRSHGVLLFFLWLFAALGISSLMLILSFTFQDAREFLKAEAGLLFGAALAEGIVQGGMTAVGDKAGYGLLLAGGVGAGILWKAVDRWGGEQKFYYQVTLFYRGKQVEAKGFLDSGNHLCDPLSGKAVHVADRELVEELCPKLDKVRMIPYRTIEGGGMLMTAVCLDRMEAVQEKRRVVYEKPLVGVSPKKLRVGEGCRILLHE